MVFCYKLLLWLGLGFRGPAGWSWRPETWRHWLVRFWVSIRVFLFGLTTFALLEKAVFEKLRFTDAIMLKFSIFHSQSGKSTQEEKLELRISCARGFWFYNICAGHEFYLFFLDGGVFLSGWCYGAPKVSLLNQKNLLFLPPRACKRLIGSELG